MKSYFSFSAENLGLSLDVFALEFLWSGINWKLLSVKDLLIKNCVKFTVCNIFIKASHECRGIPNHWKFDIFQQLVQANNKENIKARHNYKTSLKSNISFCFVLLSHYLPGEPSSDWWIPLTKGQ